VDRALHRQGAAAVGIFKDLGGGILKVRSTISLKIHVIAIYNCNYVVIYIYKIDVID
jgi:hypothetical protein